MKKEYIKIASKQDGLQLDTLIMAPESPKAVLQLVHGMCEHKERYIPFMEFMVGQGYACVIHDHRGHGGSIKAAGDLGFFYENGKVAVVEDIYQVMSEAKARFGAMPYFLMGHSMGSLAVRCFIKKYDSEIDGLIVCGSPSANPMAGAGIGLVRLLQKFKGAHGKSKLVDNMVIGSFEKPYKKEQTKNAWICSDKAVVEQYNADPLCGYSFTLNGYEALLGLMKDTYSKEGWQVAKSDLPIRFIAGVMDPCITNVKAFQKAVDFMRDRGYRNVTSKLYKDMRHEILNETCKEHVYEDIATFCNRKGL
ncbi:MAG: alpha/beta hydrolase [Lachnospiraceae bacterium]|nr:alpha/beta hydrolase [Lachnospiraceae bacterium]